ncbi:MAG: FAD-dependent oxidoreductase [Rhodoblastus sp.]|nr:MAG: FAD-dependent oxidoreductase [Rhodoblastus sp.]
MGASLSLPFIAKARAQTARVVVIGAGLAGLAAAQALKAKGIAPMVLEARERIGGRVHTSTAWPDLPMDLGASWIHGVSGNPVTELARAAGARFVATDFDADQMLGPDGKTIEPDLSRAEAIVARALKAAQRRDADVSVARAVMESADWKATTPADQRLVRHVINATLEQEYGGAASALSAWYGDDSEEFDGDDAIFPAGYGQIAAHIAKGLDIRLGKPVAEVAPGRVTLAGGEVVAADRILVSVPLGVLKAGDLRFARPLADRRAKAIESLQMGLLNKTWLRFEKIAWPRDVDWFEWLGPRAGVWAEWVSLARVLKAPVLVGFNAADEAREIEELDDRATVASAHEALRAMFGARFPAPVAAQVTRWGQDRWTHGAYSFNPVGMRPDQRDALFGTDWDGALGFCGEACSSRHFRTAHGAVATGRKLVDAMF